MSYYLTEVAFSESITKAKREHKRRILKKSKFDNQIGYFRIARSKTLHGGRVSIAKRSARSGGMVCGGFSGGVRLMKDIKLFDIDDGKLKLRTKNGNQGRSRNDKEVGTDNNKKRGGKGKSTDDSTTTGSAKHQNDVVENITSQTRGLRVDESK